MQEHPGYSAGSEATAHTHCWLEAQASVQIYEAERYVLCPPKEGWQNYCGKPLLAKKPKERSLCHLSCKQRAERNCISILKEDIPILWDPQTLSREPKGLLTNTYNLLRPGPSQTLPGYVALHCHAQKWPQGPLATTV